MSPARVILNLTPRLQAQVTEGRVPSLYTHIHDLISRRGGTVGFGPPRWMREPDGDLHVIDNAQIPGPGQLTAATAYLDKFWHLDPEGVLAHSRIRNRVFDAESVPPRKARLYYKALRERFVVPRISRYNQPRAVQAVPDGAIAVFLQGPAPYVAGQAFLDADTMLRVVAAGAGMRPVVVKPHPLFVEDGRALIAALRADGLPLIESLANVHDILAAASVTVSVNSGAAMEGFLHGKPAILFGQSDFAQMVETVRNPEDFAPALVRALATARPYERFIYWYFGTQCLWLDDPDLDRKVLAIFAEAGFDAERLGLTL
ncbi:hypothetical protein [Sedimentimonas flavescens]|uniref:hypothetical protein n=1 Tax=Sedimentimonas flavescens TaxID=2851012 RepID=UPI001C4A088B|nr:hypothetical protein [Sedimentimonas flavescens]MBW0158355.1 hypothetical protein [Sedimentimonas flavescens]